jgi:hypothetical protein
MCSFCGWDSEAKEPEELDGTVHEHDPRINLATAWLECRTCGVLLFDLNTGLPPVLRVKREEAERFLRLTEGL